MKTKSEVYASIWPKLEVLALEKDILDGVDAALILTLCRRIERQVVRHRWVRRCRADLLRRG